MTSRTSVSAWKTRSVEEKISAATLEISNIHGQVTSTLDLSKRLITNCSITVMENLEDINRGLIERNDNVMSFDKKLKDLSEPTDIKKVTGSVKDDFVPSTALTYLAPLLRRAGWGGPDPRLVLPETFGGRQDSLHHATDWKFLRDLKRFL